jgi:uncharacterized membrane protein
VLVVVVLGLCVALCLMPTGWNQEAGAGEVTYARGRIVEVDDSDVGQFGVVRQGEQHLRVRIQSGRHAGQVVAAGNTLVGDLELDTFYRPDMAVLLAIGATGDQVEWVTPRWPYRLGWEALLFAMFAVLLVATMGWTGV